MCYKCRFRCLIRGLMSPTSQPELSPSNTRTSTHSSIENHSVPPFKHNTTALIFAAIPPSPSPPPPSQKLSGPFMWAAAERGTLSGNRCSAGLMLALRWSVRFANMKQSWLHSGDPRPPPPPSHPPLLFSKAARCQKHMQPCWIWNIRHISQCVRCFLKGRGGGGGRCPTGSI